MTNLRDLLNDLIIEIEDITLADGQKRTDEQKQDILDEYIETIKNRIVG